MAGHLRPITTALGLLFLAFAIPDWFVLDSRMAFTAVFAMRITCFLYLFFLGIHIRKSGSAKAYCRWITSAELLCVALFIVTFLLYDHADFLIQSFGLMLLLSAFYLVPNRFPYQLAVSLIAIAAFLNAGWLTLAAVPVMNIAAVAVYLILIMAISTIAFVRTSYYKRRQYVNSEYLRQLSITDPLTCIYNRQKFNEELWREISRYRRTLAPLAVVLMDFDNFKGINDRYGHQQGDRVLVQAASVIRREIRITDVFARWGGEEFVLLLPGTNLAQAGELGERLRVTVSALCLESGVLLPGDLPDGSAPPVPRAHTRQLQFRHRRDARKRHARDIHPAGGQDGLQRKD